MQIKLISISERSTTELADVDLVGVPAAVEAPAAVRLDFDEPDAVLDGGGRDLVLQLLLAYVLVHLEVLLHVGLDRELLATE